MVVVLFASVCQRGEK